MVTRPLALALLLLAAPAAAQEYYDPRAVRVIPDEVWATLEGVGMAQSNAQVTVPGAGTFDVDIDLLEGRRCPPTVGIKRKLRDHSLVAVEAVSQWMGSHEDGFTKIRLFHWGPNPATLHIVVEYCVAP